VYSGPGLTRVWTDDLEIGPVLEEPKPVVKPGAREESPGALVTPRAAEVKLEREQLVVSGKKFFMRAIRHTGTPLTALKDTGFNTVWMDEQAPEQAIEQAVNLGFWLVPMLSADDKLVRGGAPGQLTSSSASSMVGRRMARFLQQDAVLCWDLGGGLAVEEYTSVSRTAGALRTVDPLRPLTVDVWDGFQRYSRGIDQVMLGIHRFPLMTSLELGQYRDWLT